VVISGSHDGRARPAGSTLELSGHNLDKRVRTDHPLRRINAALTIDISRDAQQDPGLVHHFRDWYSSAAADFGWVRGARRENTRCGL
jgi:hypothetical protein